MKTELLGYRINMIALQLNIKTLKRLNSRLMFHLRNYVNGD